jgi:hypothetical protein
MHPPTLRRPHLVAFVLLAAVALVAAAPDAARAQPGTQSDLAAVIGQGAGHVLVSPTAEDQGTFAVQITVNVHDAAPLTTFAVSRAVDLQPDGVCTGTAFVLFPGAALTTSRGGAGATHIELHRGAPFVSGVSFDVVFRAAGDAGSVLQSGCLTVTVK